jgi:glyoxylase-like metal-dependent hydrolase (beta-lactamase superfamily II)
MERANGSERLDEGAFFDARRVGEATVTIISDGTLTWTPHFPVPKEIQRQAMPDAGPRGELTCGLNVALIQLGDAVVLIDPGCDDPASSWQQEFATRFPPVERSPGFAAGLARLGIAPRQVTHVPITHAHADHYAGLVVERDGRLEPHFPQARHLLGRADWEHFHARSAPDSDFAQRLGLIERLGLLDLVEGEREIVPGLTMLPAPGESPGHYVVRLRSAGESFYYLGDLFHHACEFVHLDWAPPGRDPAIRTVRERLLPRIADDDALVVTAHERFPGWGRVMASADGYRFARV